MARIGEFDAAKRELSGEKDDFGFCGEDFVVEQPMPAVLILQLGASISGKIDETEGFAAIWEALRVSLTVPEHHRLAATDEYDQAEEPDADGNRFIRIPEDDGPFKKLYGLAVKNDVNLDQMMRLVMALFQAQDRAPYTAGARLLGWAAEHFAEFEHLVAPPIGGQPAPGWGDDRGGSGHGRDGGRPDRPVHPSGADWLNHLSPRRAVNEVYLHLLAQRSHHEQCTNDRCDGRCDVLAFHRTLEEPLLLSDVLAADTMQKRLEGLVHGEIPA